MSPKNHRKSGCSRIIFWLSFFLVFGTACLTAFPLLDSRYSIIIDPGHGGYDAGAVGIIEEADMTESTAQLLAEMLQKDGRFRVFLTREKDESASLTERCAAARKHHADLLLSIHGNWAEDPSVEGFECFPAPPGRKHYENSLRFAGLLAEQMAESGGSLRGENGIRYAYYTEDGTKFFAEYSDTQIRTESSFAVVDSSGCPAVLAEQCFVTSTADVDAFGDDDGCAKAAEAYYLAILDYFGEASPSQ